MADCAHSNKHGLNPTFWPDGWVCLDCRMTHTGHRWSIITMELFCAAIAKEATDGATD